MLKGKNAIITGGIRGIGRSIAEEFCKEGANVVLCYRSNEEKAEASKEELLKYGTKIILKKGDIADAEFCKNLVNETVEELGSLEILVNNAGITADKLVMRMTEDDFDKVMMKKRYGRIINLSSIVGIRGNAGQVNYSASKAGLIGMTLSAAKEFGKRGITVNAVAPGFIETDMTKVLTEAQQEMIKRAISLEKIGKPEDVAKGVLFLASDNASYITGQVLGIDGGMAI